MLTVFIGFMDVLFMIILVFFGCIFSIVTNYNERQNIDYSREKIIITCKEDKEKEVDCFKLDD